MKFALIDGTKAEAIKGAKGTCPICDSELIAKCGEIKVNHWAHKKIRNCDPWWENETEWHRSWKNNFPESWQETILLDKQTGEKHIADIQTNQGFVIEFQHSHIDPQERTSRENFYKDMVWVVDGTRLKRDYPRFLKGRKNLRKTKRQRTFFVDFPEKCFPFTWLASSKPVIFDFRGTKPIEDSNDLKDDLYCLFPKENKREQVLSTISRKLFLNAINTYGTLFPEPKMEKVNTPLRNKTGIRMNTTHYYDPHAQKGKGGFKKKRRF